MHHGHLTIFIVFNSFVLFVNCAPQQTQFESDEGQTESEFVLFEEPSTPPEPPENIQLLIESGSKVQLRWDAPQAYPIHSNEKGMLQYEVDLEPLKGLNLKGEWPQTFMADGNELILDGFLQPGASYRIRVRSKFQSQLSPPVETNFTTLPNAPSHFVLWFRNETTLMVIWEPPTGIFDQYKLELTTKAILHSTLFISKEEYESGVVRAAFHDLTPGRAYNISLVTLSEGQPSLPLVFEYRTKPLKPSNVSVTVMDFKTHPEKSVIVEWDPPQDDLGEYDGFSVYINHWGGVKPSQKFVSRTKPSRALLEDPLLIPGETYEVIVKTVSGRISSSKLSHNFIFQQDPN